MVISVTVTVNLNHTDGQDSLVVSVSAVWTKHNSRENRAYRHVGHDLKRDATVDSSKVYDEWWVWIIGVSSKASCFESVWRGDTPGTVAIARRLGSQNILINNI